MIMAIINIISITGKPVINKKWISFFYGRHGLLAFEIKRSSRFDHKDLRSLKLFMQDYPGAKCYFIYGGTETFYIDNVEIIPYPQAICTITQILDSNSH